MRRYLRWLSSFGFGAVIALSAGGSITAPDASAAEAPVVISQGVDTVTLDPLKRTITPTDNVVNNMFETLLRRDREGKLIPWVAVSWRRVDPTTWEFKLRHDVRFWNGDPLTSADVKFSIEKVKDPAEASEQTPFVATVERIETPDAYTVRFLTAKPAALLPANPWYQRIVDAKYWREHGDAYQAEHPMGSGAFIFDSWRRDEAVTMHANPNWWHGKPAIERVVFKPIPEPAARVAAVRTGESDLITNVPVQYQLQLQGGRNTRLTSARSVRVLFIAFNTFKPGPQQNKLVRQAFNYALDVPALVRTVLGGRGFPNATPLPPNFFGFDPIIQPYGHDLARAKRLLAEAGYPEGKGLEMVLNAPTGRYNKDRELAEAIAGQLAQTGAKITTKITEWAQYSDLIGRRALAPMYELGWGSTSYDADNTLVPLFTDRGRLSTYDNPAVDKLVFAAQYELDPKRRAALYAKAQSIIHEEAPWLFLFQYEDLYATSKRLVWEARGDEQIYCDEMKLAGP